MTLEQVTHIADIASGVAQVVLVGGLYLAWRQLRATFQDIKFRSRREAGVFATNQAVIFAEMIEVFDTFYKHFQPFIYLDAETKKFISSEISNDTRHNYGKLLKSLRTSSPDEYRKILRFQNNLESWSLAFTSGMADEEIVFGPLAESYCAMIENFYVHYSLLRKEINSTSFASSILLYHKWKNRLKSKDMHEQIQKLQTDFQAANMQGRPIPVVGEDLE